VIARARDDVTTLLLFARSRRRKKPGVKGGNGKMSVGGGTMDLSHLGRREGGSKIDPLERIAADIAALRAAHVIEPLMLNKNFNLLAAGDRATFDSQGRRVSWIIAQAFTGVVDLYWTDGGGSGTPPMRFEPTPFPILIPVSVKPYVFTAIANGAAATFSLTLVA
jgi:hypothetical protein